MAAPEGNKNAEIWDVESAKQLFDKALQLSKTDTYDFIGEIAKKLDTYRDIFTYLSDKYNELKPIYKHINGNLEANCFSHIKKGKIKEASGIVNLKSNHGWTDRHQIGLSGSVILPITGIQIIKDDDQEVKTSAKTDNGI